MTIQLTKQEIERAITKFIHQEVLGTCGNMMGHDVIVDVYEDAMDKKIVATCNITKREKSKKVSELEEVVQ